MSRTHLVIPDTQVKEGVPTDHLKWISAYIVDRRPDVVVHLGDHWDMPSLSLYDKPGSKTMEGKRYRADVDAGNAGFELLNSELVSENKRLARNKKTQWKPELHLLRGNHEERILRAIEREPKLEGVIGYDDLKSPGWQVHDFQDVVTLDDLWYSHYFYNPMNGRPYTGTIENILKSIGHSFVQGHRQTHLSGIRYVGNEQQRGLISGACYLHHEDYRGPQGNYHWRGVSVLHEVQDGAYDLMEVSLNYLCGKYEGRSLAEYMKKKHLLAV